MQREDDKPETVRSRLETYQRETEPITDVYKYVTTAHRTPWLNFTIQGSWSTEGIFGRQVWILWSLMAVREPRPTLSTLRFSPI